MIPPTEHELVDAVNDAKTEMDRRLADERLRGFREGVRSAGGRTDMWIDFHTGARYGFPDLHEGCPPICCGVRLDWTPDGYPTHADVVEAPNG